MKTIRLLLLISMFAAFPLRAGDAPAASQPAQAETFQPAQPEKILVRRDDAVITTEGNNKTVIVKLFPLFHVEKYRGRKIVFRMNVKRTEGGAPLKCRLRCWAKPGDLLADKRYPIEYGRNGETVPVECILELPNMEQLKHIDMSIAFTRRGLEKCTWELSDARFVEYEEISSPAGKKTVDMGLPAEFTAEKEKQPLVLVKDGKIGFVIVTADKPDAIAQFAAKELKDHFALACGAAPEIIKESQYKSGPAIMVGETGIAKKFGIDPALLPPETLVVVRLGDVIVLTGGDNPAVPAHMVPSTAQVPTGTLYAAYEFLEKTVGFRWYWPGKNGTYIPEVKDLEVKKLFTTSQPRYDTRITLYSSVVNDPDVSAKDSWIWYRRNRFGGSKGNPVANHAFNGWVKRFAQTHPEYFALQSDGKRKTYSEPYGGHICMSNPDVLRQTVEDKLAEFEKNKFSSFAKVMPGDANGSYYCKCPECQAKIRPEMGSEGLCSDAVWGFVNKVAAEIAAKAPGKTITCCAYEQYRRRPSFPLMPNIAITLCYYPPPRAGLQYKVGWLKMLNEWGSTGARLYMWEYWCHSRYYRGVWGAPAVFPRQLKELYLMDAGRVSGHAIELCNKDGDGKPFRGWSDWIYDVQNLYVAGKLLWDPAATDVEAILDEYYPKFFGPAAAPVRQFHEEMEKAWLENGYQNNGWDYQQAWLKAYPPEFVDRMMGLLREAVSLAGDCEPYAYRTKKLLAGYEPFERNSRMFRGMDKETNPKNVTVPKISGAPSDADWEKAAVLQNFVDSYNTYQLKTETVFRLLHDGKNLYVKAECRIPTDAVSVRWVPEGMGKRDGMLWNYESAEFFLARGKESYQFIFAPDNCLQDRFNSPKEKDGAKWNAEKIRWSAVREGGYCWKGFLTIPLDELQFAEAGKKGEYLFNACHNCQYTLLGEPKKYEQRCYLPTFGSFQNIDRFGTLILGR